MNKAAFFDRDGTINVNIGHLHECDKLKFIPGRPELIKHYNDEGYKVIVVTNQAGIAKGYYTIEDMLRLHDYMNQQLRVYCGAHIDSFYFCPHHPDFTGECKCRKPEPGMIKQAIREWDIDVTQSILYGDKLHDIEAGVKCGIKSILLASIEWLEIQSISK